MCSICDRIFCYDHYDGFRCTNAYPVDYYDVCTECFLNDTKSYECVHIIDALKYIKKIESQKLQLIEKLQKSQNEKDHLQRMLDYEPGGKGFIEVRDHFNALIPLNQ